jgi:hypothetical protein
MAFRQPTLLAALGAAAALGIGSCGDSDEEAPPLDPAAVIAAVQENVDATNFCTPDQLALEPGESVTCPAASSTDRGPVEGDLVLTREGEEEELTYELSLSGPGGTSAGAGSFSVTAEGLPAGDGSAAATGSALERRLSESLDGAEVSCDSRRPPAKGESVTCTARGTDEDGEAFEGRVTVRRSPGAQAVGAEYSYEATLEKEGGGTRFSGGIFSLS